MGLAVPRKNWNIETVANVAHGNEGIDQKDLMIAVKNQRVAFGNVISGSSNGLTGGMGAGDLIHTPADIFAYAPFNTGPVGAISWWVTTQPGSGAQDLTALVYDGGGGEWFWRIVHSPAGHFVGGSNTALPTADDQTVAWPSLRLLGQAGDPEVMVAHVFVSEDLTCARIALFCDSLYFGYIAFDEAVDAVDTWIHPSYAIVDRPNVTTRGGVQNVGDVDDYSFGVTGGPFLGWGPSGAIQMAAAIPAVNFTDVTGRLTAFNHAVTIKEKTSNLYRFTPSMELVVDPASPDGGHKGRVPDMWAVPHGAFINGDNVPLDASRERIILGDWMLVWNGTRTRVS